LRVASLFMTCAAPFMTCEIFSRALRSWMPTLVTPIGHGELPGARCGASLHASQLALHMVPQCCSYPPPDLRRLVLLPRLAFAQAAPLHPGRHLRKHSRPPQMCSQQQAVHLLSTKRCVTHARHPCARR